MPPKKRGRAASPPGGDNCMEPKNLKVGELRAELGNLGLDTTGKKAELVARLEDALKGEEDPPPSKKVKVETDSVDYSKIKVSDLRKELESRGLDTVGKKAELVARLEGGTKEAKTKEEPKEEVVEETDFSKAVRALTKADTSKKETLKQRKIDRYFPTVGYSVLDDWDCMLNQTNIGHNNNKFYIIQLAKGSGTTTTSLWTRWGRVGEIGQNALKHFGTFDEAAKEFKKKFSDKTKNKWDNRDKFVPVQGKYMLIEMDDEGDEEEEEVMGSKLAALDEPDSGPITKVKPCTLDKPTQDLVQLLFNADMFMNALKGLEIDTKKMPLGKLSKIQIAKGFEALEAVEAALDAASPRSKLSELTSKFYTIIPHDFGRRVPPVIDNKETLQKKFDMLLVLGDIELAQGLQKNQDKSKTKDISEVPHPLDLHYESLKANLKLLDRSSHDYHVISKYMGATGPQWRNLKLLDVWRVDRHNVNERFKTHDSITRRSLLWHGTNVAVVAAILMSGLRIMPHSGGRVGKGIYHASENSKSASYVRSAGDGTGIMFLNEVALGNEHMITMDDHTLTQPPSGYDSVVARGRTEPDSKDDTTLILDGKSVTVPQGKPMPTTCSTSNFHQSEYLVYKESQSRIRYMLKIKF